MEYLSNVDDVKLTAKTAIALGKFDGVHIGHQKLIHKVMEKKEKGLLSVLFTFDKSAAGFLRQFDFDILLTKEERRKVLSKYSIDYVIECEFTKEFASMSPEAFIEEILVKRLNIGYIAVGVDCTFGYKAKGDYKLLQAYSKKYDFEVEVVEKVTYKESEISSTRIRKSIEVGELEDAFCMLGYPYPILEQVIHGKKLGRTLGIPTINMVPILEKLLPPNGVYASKIIIDGKSYEGVTNIGYKPTVSTEVVRGVETYIFDYNADLYGKELEVDLYWFEREELKFESIDQLKKEMEKDIIRVKEYFKNHSFSDNL